MWMLWQILCFETGFHAYPSWNNSLFLFYVNISQTCPCGQLY
jgi:hypothetical protein